MNAMVLVILLALLPLAVAAGSVATAVDPAAVGDGADRSDAEFLQAMLADAEEEVEAALAALRRPLPEAERSLATQMLSLGETMERELRTLARERGLAPGDPDPRRGEARERAGDSFADAYLHGRIEALERLAARCHAIHAASDDPEVLAFAALHLPDLLRRLDVAQRRLTAAGG